MNLLMSSIPRLKLILIAGCFSVAFFSIRQSYGGENLFSIVGGVSTSCCEYRTGFAINGNVFHSFNNRFAVGLRAGFNRWTSNDPYIKYDSMIEIVPSIRIYATINPRLRAFGQVGVGLWIERIRKTYGWDNDSMGGINISLGGGFDININKKLSAEIMLLVQPGPFYEHQSVFFGGGLAF